MPRLHCRLDDSRHPVDVLRLEGVLDLHTAWVARTASYKCLAGEPSAVVVDLAGVSVDDDMALMIFPALARAAANWPGVEVLLCAASAPVAALLRRLGVLRYLPLLPDEGAAVARAALRQPPSRMRLRLSPVPTACAVARDFVRRACADWDIGVLVERAELVVTELVANAVVHARTEIVVAIALAERYLQLSVQDRHPGTPRMGSAGGPGELAGRGLLIVDALAGAWGTIRTGEGKIVWTTFPRPRPTQAPSTTAVDYLGHA